MEVKYHERMLALQNKKKTHKTILPFVTEYRPSVPNCSKSDSQKGTRICKHLKMERKGKKFTISNNKSNRKALLAVHQQVLANT